MRAHEFYLLCAYDNQAASNQATTMRTRKISIIAAIAVCLFAQSASHATNLYNWARPALSVESNVMPVESRRLVAPRTGEELRFSFAPLVKQVAPAVVNIYAARKVARRSPFEGDPFFERFFGRGGLDGRRPKKRVQRSLGSGVIVGSKGIVVTNYHVIKDATEIKVALADGQEFESEVLLNDERSDLAVLRILAERQFPKAELGDSEALEVGDIVLAIGNPFGVGQTVTSGIISALARPSLGKGDFGFFIQTDASINPGNSGGALVDMNGRVIGINTAIYSRSGGSIGIGFAIPSKMVEVVLRSAAAGSNRVIRPWIGAEFQSLTADIAESLGMRQPVGALVAGLRANGPGKKAGLQVGDVILKVNGNAIPHVDALGYWLSTIGIGRKATFEILSRERRKTVTITLSTPPETVPRDQREIKGRSPFSGADVANLSPAIAAEIGLRGKDKGVVVLNIRRGSLASRFGLQPRDIVREVNGEIVKSTRQLAEIVASRPARWRYTLERGNRIIRQAVR